MSRILRYRMRHTITAAVLDRERLVPLAHTAQQLRQIRQLVGHDVDHRPLSLYPAV
ncbi:MAG: hypothetical protein ACRYF2_06475 [Janthinobacterium lividum]